MPQFTANIIFVEAASHALEVTTPSYIIKRASLISINICICHKIGCSDK
jgi:hypothetical protein